LVWTVLGRDNVGKVEYLLELRCGTGDAAVECGAHTG
jgi:hypothetical protein